VIFSQLIASLNKLAMLITVSSIIIGSVIDTSIIRISVFAGWPSSSIMGIEGFIIIFLMYMVGQAIILDFIKRKSESIKSHRLNVSHRFVVLSQLVIIAIFISIILEMIFTSSYSVILIDAVIWISCGVSITLLGLLFRSFFSWFRSNRNLVVLAYTVATAILALNSTFVAATLTNKLSYQEQQIQHLKNPVSNFVNADNIFNSVYTITSVLSFLSIWVATILLMHHYSKKLGRAKYWILVSIPLVYFLSQFQGIFLDLFASFRLSSPVLFGIVYTLVFSVAKPIGGVLFGIGFWSVGRTVGHYAVKDYMRMSGYGIMLLFSSNQITGLILAQYPPFGLATLSFLGLASYLVLVGIYSSAISVAQDVKLRRFIRNTLQQQTALLDNIGTSQMEQEIQERVMKITKNLSSETDPIMEANIKPSLEDDEIKEYMKLTLEEIKASKKNPDT
jgi:hypothetical protein